MGRQLPAVHQLTQIVGLLLVGLLRGHGRVVGARPRGERHVPEHAGADVVVFLAELGEVVGRDERSVRRGFASCAARSLASLFALGRSFLGNLFLLFGLRGLASALLGCKPLSFGCGSPLTFGRGFLLDAPALGAFALDEGLGFEAFLFGLESALFFLTSTLGGSGHFGFEPLTFLDSLPLGGFGFLP
jgi:hypothetical protein